MRASDLKLVNPNCIRIQLLPPPPRIVYSYVVLIEISIATETNSGMVTFVYRVHAKSEDEDEYEMTDEPPSSGEGGPSYDDLLRLAGGGGGGGHQSFAPEDGMSNMDIGCDTRFIFS